MQETQVPSLGQEDPLEQGMRIHSSILAWRILWTEVPRGLQSMGSQRVRHYLATRQQKKVPEPERANGLATWQVNRLHLEDSKKEHSAANTFILAL